MKCLHGTWFETKVRVPVNGKMTKKIYAVEASCWSEAEANILKYMRNNYEGDSCLDDIKKSPYIEICLSDEEDELNFYKVKVNFYEPSESGALKKVPQTYLVEASSIQEAPKALASCLQDLEYEQVSVQKTNIYDILKREE